LSKCAIVTGLVFSGGKTIPGLPAVAVAGDVVGGVAVSDLAGSFASLFAVVDSLAAEDGSGVGSGVGEKETLSVMGRVALLFAGSFTRDCTDMTAAA
jgi:hypothetical protein